MIEDLVKKEIGRVTRENERHVRPIKKVSGYVPNPQKSPLQKFADVFFEEDIRTVKESLVSDVIVPTIKGFFADTLIGGIERLFYGNSKRRTNSNGFIRTMGNNLVRDYVPKAFDYSTRNNRTTTLMAADEGDKFSFTDVVMRDRASAQDLLDTLRESIRQYGNVSVAELYDALDATEEAGSDYSDNYWGWTNLDHVVIKRTSSGYWLDLPKPVSLR